MTVPALPPSEVAALVLEIGAGLRARDVEIAETMTRRITHEITHTRGDPRLAALRAASIHANVVTMIEILANDIPVGHLQPPMAAVEYARRVAQRGIPSNFLVRSYHMGQNVMMRICYGEIGQRNLPPALGLAVVERLTEIVYSYADWIILSVLETYEAERVRSVNARGTVHAATVHPLLSATPPDPIGFEIETGYTLERTHLAAILWCTDGDEAAAPELLDSGARALAAALNTDGPPLVTAIDRRTVWAWFPHAPQTAVDPRDLRSAADLPQGARLAIGLPGRGLEGFRRSHQQAAAAYFVATVPGTPADHRAIGFADPGVAVVSLLAKDLDSTRAWVREVLGALADDTDQAATLRDTLNTFYEIGESHVHTAQRMTLHRNTVKYRITKALAAIRADGTAPEKLDIALALRICHFLGTNVLRPPS
ncbi:PucR family transcriptional regulator [Nocardia wallacei]|uniref:PucR family transcriptional regulator n=1 Tax=Nocardia wallacei TaxID=480035 RepID=UPI002454708F|nr:helix-turn-helix domain-containing protein [Nocardia wallacei]